LILILTLPLPLALILRRTGADDWSTPAPRRNR
jgi:hypothetical protein